MRVVIGVVGFLAFGLGPSLGNAQLAGEEAGTFVLPTVDSSLQRALDREMGRKPFKPLVARGGISVALVDLSDPGRIRYAAVDDDRMRYAASLPKIAVMLGVFDAVARGELTYTPELRKKLVAMIRKSSNSAASELIGTVGFESIERTLRDPRYELYDRERNGGLWVGKDYGGPLGYYHRDPMHNLSHGATARQVARFFVMLEQGELVDAWSSDEMKQILGKPAIRHKFVKGLQALPNLLIFRKSGTWKRWHADAALVEHDGKRYVAVALAESQSGDSILSKLIARLDDIARASPPEATSARAEPSKSN